MHFFRVFSAAIFLLLSATGYSEAQKLLIAESGKDEIRFKFYTAHTEKPFFANLGENKILALSFPMMEGVVKLKIGILVKSAGREKKIERYATVRPNRGSRELRFDFTSDPEWNGLGKELTLELFGPDAVFIFPQITLEPPAIAERLSIFFETWMRPTELRGLAVNVLFWPDFLGVPASSAVGVLWILGCLLIAVIKKFKGSHVAGAVFAWSLLLWVTLDLSLKLNYALSIPRLAEMKEKMSDSTGIIPAQTSKVTEMLKRHNVTRLGVVGGNFDDVIFRFELLPARVNRNYIDEKILLVKRSAEITVTNGELLSGGRVILRDVEKLDAVDSLILLRRNR